MGWKIDAYLWNKYTYSRFNNTSSKKRPPNVLWQKCTQIGGSDYCWFPNAGYQQAERWMNNEPPIYLDIWTTWVINGYLTFSCEIFYTPKDGSAEVSGGKARGWISVNKDYATMNHKFARRTFKGMSGYCWTIQLDSFLNNMTGAGVYSNSLDEIAMAAGASFDDRLADRYKIRISAVERWTDGKDYSYGPWTFYLTYLPTEATDVTISNVDTDRFCVMFDTPWWFNYTNSFALGDIWSDKPNGSGQTSNPVETGYAPTEFTLLPNESETGSSIVLSTEKNLYHYTPSWTDGETYRVFVVLLIDHIAGISLGNGTKVYTVYPCYMLDAVAEDIGDMDAPWSDAVRNSENGVTVYVETNSLDSPATSATVSLIGGLKDEIITKELDCEDESSVAINEEPLTDLAGTAWTLKETLDLLPAGTDYEINFTSDLSEDSYTALRFTNSATDGVTLAYGASGVSTGVYSEATGWYTTGKEITITDGTDATNAELIAWLQANAKQTAGGEGFHLCIPFEFPLAPRGECDFTVVAEDALERVTTSYLEVSEETGNIFSRGITIMKMDGSDAIYAMFNVEISESPEADTVEVQLNGRSRPSVFWGETGKHERSVSFEIPWSSPLDYKLGTQKEQIAAWRLVPFNGVHLVFFPDGERVAAQISDLSIERNYLEDKTASVSFKVVEVDA